MHRMVATTIPCKLSLCADCAQACAGDSHASSGIDVACPTPQSALAIASPNELHGDSWPSSSTGASSFCSNHQYSITSITNSTGSVSERYAYSAYSQPTILDASASVLSSSAINNRYTYTGREWDATLGLHHFRARWMSGLTGRFLTRNAIGWRAGQFSFYAYLNDRPVSGLDPSGLCQKKRTDKECCDAAKTTKATGAALDAVSKMINSGINDDGKDDSIAGSSIGGVICCDGRKVSCVWESGGNTNTKNKKGREIIDLCITEHEKEHEGQLPDCDPKPDLYRPKVPRDKKDRYECDAYTREKKCLETHKKDCAGDAECESAVESEIEHAEQGIKKYCK